MVVGLFPFDNIELEGKEVVVYKAVSISYNARMLIERSLEHQSFQQKKNQFALTAVQSNIQESFTESAVQ